ncbi:hypothetical protein HDC35_003041 [Sphingopyxis sp. JAI128]|nr:hypothetical protein [Sphingopyxis sp. JAI128]
MDRVDIAEAKRPDDAFDMRQGLDTAERLQAAHRCFTSRDAGQLVQ